jgi:hypothetical protein
MKKIYFSCSIIGGRLDEPIYAAIVDRLDRADIVAPLVTAVVAAPQGAWPTSCHPLYPLAGDEIMDYLEACGHEDFEGYLRQRLAR